MGKGYHNYMSKKFFHPGSFENIKKVWIAQQKDAHEKKSEEETLTQYQKEQEMYQNRALLGDEKAKLGLNFMYDPPPGVKRDREREEDEPEYKFEWQRKFNAPRESYAKGDDTVRDQPFGIEVRNVRCLKCRKWGHINTDKICPLFGNSITAEPPQSGSNNPGELMEQMAEEGLAFTKKVLSRQNDPEAANQQMVDSDAEADEEIAFFLTLNRKEKKKLIKKLEKSRKKTKKERRRVRKRRAEALKEKQENEATEQPTETETEKEEPRQPYRRRHRLSGEESEETNPKQSRAASSGRKRDDLRDTDGRDRESRRNHDDRNNDRPTDASNRREKKRDGEDVGSSKEERKRNKANGDEISRSRSNHHRRRSRSPDNRRQNRSPGPKRCSKSPEHRLRKYN